jgi:hypothetical protein
MHARAALAASLVVSLAAAAAPAAAQDRPSEEELFGAPPPPGPATPAGEGEGKGEGGRAENGRDAPEKTERPEEAQLFGAPPAAQAAPPPPQRLGGRDREDALAVGGQLYLRAQSVALEGQDAGDWSLSFPNILDVYLDARPNDRVRAFALGRLSWDPSLPPEGTAPPVGQSLLDPAAFLARGTSEPRGDLDQLWVNFDVGRRAFLTVGRQHVKWGVGRFWNPTDYLHPVRRDPLAVFDVRTGTGMVKLHVPWEARGWNAYGVAVVEDIAGDPPRAADGSVEGTGRVGRVGVGGRAEIVLGPMELGLDALAQDGHRPRFGVDVSAGVWELDLYGEAAIRTSVDTPRWRQVPGTTDATPLLERFERHDRLGPTAQIVVGGTWAAKYSDEDSVTVGAEYFYDQSGYDHPRIYPVLLGVAGLGGAPPTIDAEQLGTTIANPWSGEPNPFTSFYLGRHYGAAFVSLPAPGRWNDTSFTLSILGNLSDKSFVARLDHSVLALTYLRVETFVAGHFGTPEGEFRLGFDLPPQALAPGQPLVDLPPSDPIVFEAGIALRVSL